MDCSWNDLKGRWWSLILLIVIPIPFGGPWWLVVICLTACLAVAGMLFRPRKQSPEKDHKISK
jgi:hypothetical protein